MKGYEALALIGLIDQDRVDRNDLTLEDISYLDNNLIQLLIDKTELLCLKYVLTDDVIKKHSINSELDNMLDNLLENEKDYLLRYRKKLLQKMDRILNPVRLDMPTYHDGDNWVWGDEIINTQNKERID